MFYATQSILRPLSRTHGTEIIMWNLRDTSARLFSVHLAFVIYTKYTNFLLRLMVCSTVRGTTAISTCDQHRIYHSPISTSPIRSWILCTPVKWYGWHSRVTTMYEGEKRRAKMMNWSLSCDHRLRLPGSDEFNVTTPSCPAAPLSWKSWKLRWLFGRHYRLVLETNGNVFFGLDSDECPQMWPSKNRN